MTAVERAYGAAAAKQWLEAVKANGSAHDYPDNEIDIAARNGVGVAGRIVAYGYHGRDAVVHVIPDSEPAAPAIVVRTLSGCALPAGSPVTLHARGPVLAWNQ